MSSTYAFSMPMPRSASGPGAAGCCAGGQIRAARARGNLADGFLGRMMVGIYVHTYMAYVYVYVYVSVCVCVCVCVDTHVSMM